MYVFSFTVVILSVILLYISLLPNLSTLRDFDKCPFCYGTDLCKDIEENELIFQFSSFSQIFYNVFSVKNVYFASFKKENVVLKKLASDGELSLFDNAIDGNRKITKFDVLKNFNEKIKVCPGHDDHYQVNGEKLVNLLREKFTLEEIWTLTHINPEPLILYLFRNCKYLPKLYGSCGRLTMEKNCGNNLNYYENYNWFVRAKLGLQLLEACHQFNDFHPDFRLYLTDISPDNIAISEDLQQVFFVDMENVILTGKTENHRNDGMMVHWSEHFQGEHFVYIENEICEGGISDHNIYAVCKLILSKNSPWPMMRGGLLHSPPPLIHKNYSHLLENIELCVHQSNSDRFNISYEIIEILKEISNK